MIDPDWSEATRCRSGSRRRPPTSSRGRSSRGDGDRQRRLGRRLRRCLLLVALGAAALALATGGVAAQETEKVSSCTALDESGTTYVLTQDVSSDANTCFNVPDDASGVTLDGQGHTVRSTGDPAAAFRYFGDGPTVRNVTLVGWREGVYGQSASGALIEDIHVRDARNHGFRLNGAPGTTIVDVSVENSTNSGFYAITSSDVRLENVTLRGNERGVELRQSSNLTVRNSTVTDNGADGVFARLSSLEVWTTVLASNEGYELNLPFDATAVGHEVRFGPSATGATLDFQADGVWFDDVADPVPTPDGNASLGRYFAVGQQTTDHSYDATLHYSDEDAFPLDESTLSPYVEDGGNRTRLAGPSVDHERNQIAGFGSDGTLGTFGAFGEPVPYLDVAVDGTPETVEGDQLTVQANVTNRGAAEGSTDVTLDAGTLGSDDASVGQLAPGEHEVVELSVPTERGDNGTHSATLTADANTSVGVRVLALPRVDLSIDSIRAPVPAGENFTVAVNATNLGDLTADQMLTLETAPANATEGTSRTLRAEHALTLDGGAHQLVDLAWSTGPNDTGNYTVTVASANDTVSRSLWVQVPANLTVSDVATNSPVTEGEPLEVGATVENHGEATATTELDLTLDGRVVTSRSVTLAGNESTPVQFRWTGTNGEAGRYTAAVVTPHDNATVAVAIEPSGGSLDPPPAESLGVEITDTNSPVRAGDDLRVTVALTNAAGTETTETVRLGAAGGQRDARTVTVPANGRTEVTLRWSTGSEDAGNHQVTVEAAEQSDAAVAVVRGASATGTRVVSIEPTTPVVEGQPVDVRATVRAGAGGFDGDVVLEAPDGDLAGSSALQLDAGERSTVTITWSTERGDAGSGVVAVRAGGDVATSTVEVREAPPFDVAVAGSNAPVAPGERLQVEATVTSRADAPAESYVRLLVDGQQRDGQSIALDPGSSRTVTLSWVVPEGATGEHEATVDVTTGQASTSVRVSEGGAVLEPPQWAQSAVEYEPSEQTRHVGGFLWLTLVVGGLGAYVLLTRRTPDARLLGVTLLTAAARTGTDVLHATVESVSGEPLLALNTILELYVGLLFLGFAASHVGREPLLKRRTAAGLAGLAVVGTVAVATNPLHSLVFTDVALQQGPFTHVSSETGPLGWAVLSVTLGSLLVAAGLLLQSFLAGTDPAWRPVGVLASALCLAVLLVGLSALQRGPLPSYDYTGAAVAGFLALASTTLFRQGLQRLGHDAKQSLIEGLEDPIVIANDAGTVLEYNAAAAEVIPGVGEGVRVDELFAHQPSWPTAGESTRFERRRSELFDPTVAATDGGTTGAEATGRRPAAAASGGDGSTEPTVDRAGSGASTAESSEPAAEPDAGTDDAAGSASDRARVQSPAAAVSSEGELLRDAEDDDVHYQVVISSVTADTGDALGFTVRFTDVTELKRRTEELARKNAQLEQVASTISHDLRNPLGVADGYVGILQEQVPADATAVEPATIDQHMGPIGRAVDRMDAIIEDILALARSAEPVASTEPVDFRAAVEEAWATVETRDATLFVESSGTVEADEQRFRRILENLFRNAVEHGGEDVAVVAGMTESGFYVADDGPGVPEEHRADVFEEGYTSAQDGTGLGLSIVAQLARAHSWHVRLDPEYAGGAHFSFGDCEVELDEAAEEESGDPAVRPLQDD